MPRTSEPRAVRPGVARDLAEPMRCGFSRGARSKCPPENGARRLDRNRGFESMPIRSATPMHLGASPTKTGNSDRLRGGMGFLSFSSCSRKGRTSSAPRRVAGSRVVNKGKEPESGWSSALGRSGQACFACYSQAHAAPHAGKESLLGLMRPPFRVVESDGS